MAGGSPARDAARMPLKTKLARVPTSTCSALYRGLHHAEPTIGCARREYSHQRDLPAFRCANQQHDTEMTAAVQDLKMRFERVGPVCVSDPPKVADAR